MRTRRGRGGVVVCVLLAALAFASTGHPASSSATSLCSAAERHQARWMSEQRRLLLAWRQANWERAALVAGSMARIARQALDDARGAPGGTSSARAFRARIVRVHEGQRRAAVLYVDAMVAAGAGRTRQAGRSYQEANVVLLRSGFVGDYC
ncbi:MAG TPA: hypothetical protein VFO26_12915 [Gaiella sp.]|uniref:hypothetical protein n=1 Tax=Gaiella sp. TaxID=2663207 RepID=UPI002D7F68F6|nr:hypothetical protein [Gaiella sp.]HET9288448.1 hypothetical protein [Gaiella sp.]